MWLTLAAWLLSKGQKTTMAIQILPGKPNVSAIKKQEKQLVVFIRHVLLCIDLACWTGSNSGGTQEHGGQAGVFLQLFMLLTELYRGTEKQCLVPEDALPLCHNSTFIIPGKIKPGGRIAQWQRDLQGTKYILDGAVFTVQSKNKVVYYEFKGSLCPN